jgi:hypothetical protein
MSQNPPPQDPPPDENGNVKIILNGDVPADVLNRVCEQIEYRRANNYPIPKTLIKTLNAVENLVFFAEWQFLHGIGFDGPWPKALKFTNAEIQKFQEFIDQQNS